mgnify:CR=1 FL=1
MKEVTCLNCGWVHMGVSSIPKDSTYDYMHCFRCGGSYSNFRPATERDCPVGCTLQPILMEGA